MSVGKNLIELKATNSLGTAKKNATVVHQTNRTSPVITMLSNSRSLMSGKGNTKRVKAIVINVSKKSDISVKINGKPSLNFTYNTSTKLLTIPVTLVSGVNKVEVTAKGAGGTASESISATRR